MEVELHESVQNNIRKAKYDKPTPVQKHAIPFTLKGRDIMACAQTGSGETVSPPAKTVRPQSSTHVSYD